MFYVQLLMFVYNVLQTLHMLQICTYHKTVQIAIQTVLPHHPRSTPGKMKHTQKNVFLAKTLCLPVFLVVQPLHVYCAQMYLLKNMSTQIDLLVLIVVIHKILNSQEHTLISLIINAIRVLVHMVLIVTCVMMFNALLALIWSSLNRQLSIVLTIV